jgi:hypothetical protein
MLARACKKARKAGIRGDVRTNSRSGTALLDQAEALLDRAGIAANPVERDRLIALDDMCAYQQPSADVFIAIPPVLVYYFLAA